MAYSIRKGLVPGALIMGKIGSSARQNSLAKALSDMGGIEKTLFLVNYPLRRRDATTHSQRTEQGGGHACLGPRDFLRETRGIL